MIYWLADSLGSAGNCAQPQRNVQVEDQGNRMGRFDKLEVSAEQPDERQSSKAENARQDRSWLEQAVEERRCGHHENALRLYSRALEDDKSIVTGWLVQVQMLIFLDELVEAELWSRKACSCSTGEWGLDGRTQLHSDATEI